MFSWIPYTLQTPLPIIRLFAGWVGDYFIGFNFILHPLSSFGCFAPASSFYIMLTSFLVFYAEHH